jgi:hypothetical protein
MLMIPRSVCDNVRAATSARDLHAHVQSAIELEHATIPPYLTAYYSIRPGTNVEVAGIIRSVVIEEMLHMTIAANLLNALGGTPEIDKPGFIPTYPGKLPMGVQDDLTVGLAPLSKRLVRDVFMVIEEPAADAPPGDDVTTIGEFYAAIQEKIVDLGDAAFVGDPKRQVTDRTWFPADELFPIVDVASAVRGLQTIVQQGEGANRSPVDPEGEPAHYYRFAEIVNGRRLRRTRDGYSFTGDVVPLDATNIFPFVENSRASMYPAESAARRQVDRCNEAYTHLLVALHDTFNGHPDALRRAIGVMYELRLVIAPLTAMKVDDGKVAAPPFAYVPREARG